MSEAAVLERRNGFICELTLNRPNRMNALSRDMVTALREALTRLHEDEEIRVIIIRGEGTRAFCAGADLKERAEMNPIEVREFVSELRALFNMLYDHPKITIAAINGFALGGGLELALSCDLRYANAGVKLGLTETKLAIIPGAGGTQLLPRVVGIAKAKELIYKARPILAEEALALGILNHVCAGENLDHFVKEEAEIIAENGPLALVQAKKAINTGMEVGLKQGLEIEKLCYNIIIPTEDRLEGLAAFKEKRKPLYRGK